MNLMAADGLTWNTETLLLFLLLAFVAEVLGTVGGFGSSVFFVPLASLFMGFYEALGITALFHVTSNLSKIAMFRKGLDKRLLLILGVPAVIGVIIGAFSTRFFDTELLEFYLGIVLIGLSIFLLVYPLYKLAATPRNAIIGGVTSGAVAGLVGTGGAIRGMTLAAFGLSKSAFVATSAFIDLGVDFSRTLIYASNGFITLDTWKLLPFLIVVGLAGTYIGKLILNRISQKRFERVVLILILLIGLSMVWKGLDI
jgi:uncharacterized membrane protein YfcA